MPFDPEHFRLRFPGRPFPDLHLQSERRRWAPYACLAERFGLPSGGADASPLWDLFERAGVIEAGDPASDRFDLVGVMAAAGVRPGGDVYVDWYHGDQARVALDELARSFGGFWERGADDLAVFDDAGDWVLYITRVGEVRVASAVGQRSVGETRGPSARPGSQTPAL